MGDGRWEMGDGRWEMALNVQWGGEHLGNVRSEHATAHPAFPIRSDRPSQQDQTRRGSLGLRPTAAPGVRVKSMGSCAGP